MFLAPKTVKAYIHQGKAYVGQGKYEEAINSYKEILTFDPKQEKIVNGMCIINRGFQTPWLKFIL